MNKDNRPECKGENPPEKIYLQWPKQDTFDDITWCADRIHENDIEYTRHTGQPVTDWEKVRGLMAFWRNLESSDHYDILRDIEEILDESRPPEEE